MGSTFYATVYGRGDHRTTKTGTKETGIHAAVQSYQGSLHTQLELRNGEVYVTIGIARGSEAFCKHHLWEGPLSLLLENGVTLTRGGTAASAPEHGPNPTP
jgi:hypothetical protein